MATGSLVFLIHLKEPAHMCQSVPESDNNVIDSLKGTDSSCESSLMNRYKQVGRAVCFTLTYIVAAPLKLNKNKWNTTTVFRSVP